MAKAHKNDLQNGKSLLLFLLFWPHWMYLGPGWVLGPVWDHFSQNFNDFLSIPTYFLSFSDSFLEAISTVNWTW